MTNSSAASTRAGLLATFSAFFLWGLMPLYFKPLSEVSALDITAWRGVMAGVIMLAWMAWTDGLRDLRNVVQQPALLGKLVISAALLFTNWGVYAWGVMNHQVLITSLGYFINPLVNVLLGTLVLAERLNPRQWLAVAIASAGVLVLTLHAGQFPWLALQLAFTFGLYGLIRKMLPVAPLTGMGCEILLITPLALGYLLLHAPAASRFPDAALTQTLLLLSGVITIVPLGLFNFGARRIQYITVGMLQYIAPTMQFIIGVTLFHETLTPERLLCFALIWLALVIYAADGVLRAKSRSA